MKTPKEMPVNFPLKAIVPRPAGVRTEAVPLTASALHAPKQYKVTKLDIACGAQKHEGFTGIDVIRSPGVNIVHDLQRFPWPIESDSVEEAVCAHYIEHIPHSEAMVEGVPQRWKDSHARWGFVRDAWFDTFEEIHRVCKDGAIVDIVVPYYSSKRADQDPTHARRIMEESFFYLDQRWLEANLCAYPYSADFRIVGVTYMTHGDTPAGRDREHDMNVVADLKVQLKVIKPSRAWWETNGDKNNA